MSINDYVKTKTETIANWIEVPYSETVEEGRRIVLQTISDAYEKMVGSEIPVEVLETSPYLNYIGILYGQFQTIRYISMVSKKTYLDEGSGSATIDPRYNSGDSGGGGGDDDDKGSRKWGKWLLLKVDSKTEETETLMRYSYLPPYETTTCSSGIKIADGADELPEDARPNKALAKSSGNSTVVGSGIKLGTTTVIQYLGLLLDLKGEEVIYEPDPSLKGDGTVYPYATVGHSSAGSGECSPNQNPDDWSEVLTEDFLFPVQDDFSISVKVKSRINEDNEEDYFNGYYIQDFFFELSLKEMYKAEESIFNIEFLDHYAENFSDFSATKINADSYLVGSHNRELFKISGSTAQTIGAKNENNMLYNFRLRRMKNISKARR